MMSIESLVAKIKSGILTFIPMITNANRDLNFHDYKKFDDGDEPTFYRVGQAQIEAHGDQSKSFVSKSTLIYSDAECTVYLNNASNVAITILANTWYEFKSNIYAIYVSAIGTGGTLYLYFEGVLPEEARSGI